MRTWPPRYNIRSSHLTSRHSILQKIIMYNWLSTTHRTVITKNFSPLLLQMGMKIKFNLGRLVFEHILGHAENAAYQKALGYPSLIYGILLAQKPDIVALANILGPSANELRISHKLYEGHHLRDVLPRSSKH